MLIVKVVCKMDLIGCSFVSKKIADEKLKTL